MKCLLEMEELKMYMELTMNEYIGTNVNLTGDDIISVKKLEVVPTK